jgi:hypothetical protein
MKSREVGCCCGCGGGYGSLIQATWGNSGWDTIVRVGSSTGQVVGGQSVVVNGFTVETRNVTLRDYTILIVFRVRNGNRDLNTVCDIAVYADTNVGSNGSHHIGPIPNGEGVYGQVFRIKCFMF